MRLLTQCHKRLREFIWRRKSHPFVNSHHSAARFQKRMKLSSRDRAAVMNIFLRKHVNEYAIVTFLRKENATESVRAAIVVHLLIR